MRDNILHFEKSAWHSYCETHLEIQIASSCLSNVTSFHFWSLADDFPDCMFKLDKWANSVLVVAYHGSTIQMKQFALSVNKMLKSVTHFLLDCSYFKQNFLSLWRNLKLKITVSNQADGVNLCQFIDHLDRHHKVLLLLGSLCLPFENVTNTLIKKFIAAAVGKIHKLCRERLRELEAPWLTKK